MRFLSRIDFKLFLPAALLVLLGSLILSSVSPSSYPRQFVNIAAAVLVFIVFANIDARILRALAPWFYILSLALLLLTLVFGVVTRGSVRWIDLGFITVQASELAKPLLAVFFAFLVSQKGDKRFVFAFLAFFPAVFLVLIQPDLGSTIVIFAGFLGALFIAGIPFRYLLAMGFLLVFSSPLLWGFLASYQKDRIISFLAPGADPLGAGYNSIQAMIAVGSGGFSGRGLGQGTQSQLAFLPERHTDFVFASLSEELGFLGAFLIILAFLFLFWRLAQILKNTNDAFSKALIGGVFATIFAQSAINIGMNLGLLPITGIPLPFVSSGGSSLVSMAAVLGISSSLGALLQDEGYLSILR